MIDIHFNHLDIDHQVGKIVDPESLCSGGDHCTGDRIGLSHCSIKRSGQVGCSQVFLGGLHGQLGLLQFEQICPGCAYRNGSAGQRRQVDLGAFQCGIRQVQVRLDLVLLGLSGRLRIQAVIILGRVVGLLGGI